MSRTIRTCDNCGSRHIQLMSMIKDRQPLFFCSQACKKEYIAKALEGYSETNKENILPEVRVLVARKTKEGIAVVRGNGGFYGRSNTPKT